MFRCPARLPSPGTRQIVYQLEAHACVIRLFFNRKSCSSLLLLHVLGCPVPAIALFLVHVLCLPACSSLFTCFMSLSLSFSSLFPRLISSIYLSFLSLFPRSMSSIYLSFSSLSPRSISSIYLPRSAVYLLYVLHLPVPFITLGAASICNKFIFFLLLFLSQLFILCG